MTRHADETQTIPADRTPPGARNGEESPSRRRPRPQTLVLGGIVLVYLLLVIGGVTTSSLGYPAVRQDPADPAGTTIGDPRGIRSDEFGVDTPLVLGIGASGSDAVEFPLSETSDLVSGIPASGDVFASIVDFDSAVLRLGDVLPVESLFAARWWFPWLLLFTALPVWLRRVGANAPMSWFATALVAASPSVAWWSHYPVRVLAAAVAGCVLGMAAADAYRRGRRVLGTAEAAVAGLLLSRLATWYVPWSITLAAPLIVATLCWLVVDQERRRGGLVAVGVAAFVAVVLLAGVYWQNWEGLRASMATAYPGQRRSTGSALALAQVFGAPGQGYFQLGREVTALNVSELSASFTFCAVWALVLAVAVPHATAAVRSRAAAGSPGRHFPRLPRLSTDPESWVIGVLAVAVGVELVWCMVSLGSLGAAVPVLNRVPAGRAAATVGMVAVLLVSLMLSRRGRSEGWRVPLLAAGASAGVTAYGVSDLQRFAPPIGAPLILLVSAAVFLIVLTVTHSPDRWRWAAVGAALATLGVAAVNPIQIGLGDLRDSDSAQQMLEAGDRARDEGTFWATDGADTDILLIATGVPTVSGVQISGPDRAAWKRLDPAGRYEGAWNRGGSSVEMTWTDGGSPVISTGAPDQIVVAVDPCDLVDRGFELDHILSRTPLENECLTPDGELEWAGSVRYVYATDLPRK
jgi:hypothetical protein